MFAFSSFGSKLAKDIHFDVSEPMPVMIKTAVVD